VVAATLGFATPPGTSLAAGVLTLLAAVPVRAPMSQETW
jgi:hypothetical protein